MTQANSHGKRQMHSSRLSDDNATNDHIYPVTLSHTTRDLAEDSEGFMKSAIDRGNTLGRCQTRSRIDQSDFFPASFTYLG